MLSIRYLTYSMFHNKDPMVGSDFIRVQQLINNWPEADYYKYGENPDALIFTKVFTAYDYKFPQHFERKKILDICDPMWLEGFDVADTARHMDAITCPTEELAKFMRQLTVAPVYVVPDRWDLKDLKAPKVHKGEAKTVVWFGYAHNADTLKPAIRTINQLGLNLLVISNDDPLLHRFDDRNPKEYYRFKKYNNETIFDDLQQADFAILPGDYRPIGRFKSDNKTTRAILAGLPVAIDGDQLRSLLPEKARQDYISDHYDKVKEEHDVKKSVEQMKQIIADVKGGNNG